MTKELSEESEERFRAIADDAPVMVWTTDADARCTYLSRSWYELTGQTPETGLGFGWLDAVHPDDQERSRRTFAAANDRRESFRLEYRIRRHDGEYRWAIDSASPRVASSGAFLGYIGSVIDIEDQKRAETAASEAAARFGFMAESMPQKVFTAKPNGDVVYSNKNWADFTGLEFSESRHWSWNEFTHPDEIEETHRRWQVSVATGKPFQLEHRFRRFDGAYRWHLSRAHLMRDPSGALWIASSTDIDDVKRAEQNLQRTVRFSEMFVGILGHDLRNPLNAITMAASLLAMRADTDKISKPVSRIAASAGRMDRMIAQLLDFTRLRLGQGFPLHRAEVDLAELCRTIIDELEPVQERKIQLEAVGDVVGSWDRDRLSQLVSNLAANACQHGALGVPIEIRLDGSELAMVHIEVRNGGAIGAELLPVMFEPLHAAEGGRPKSEGSSGLGLGLFISQQIALAHGGEIRVESTAQLGTRFTIVLPRRESATTERAFWGRVLGMKEGC